MKNHNVEALYHLDEKMNFFMLSLWSSACSGHVCFQLNANTARYGRLRLFSS